MKNQNNKAPKIAVIGDLMIDCYLWGACDRISPEAPVQVFDVNKETNSLGGAGNVVNNLLALGAYVEILSVIGDDENGAKLQDMLKEKNLNTKNIITQKARTTSKKTRLMASGQQIVRYDKESKDEINNQSKNALFASYTKILNECDIVLLSDYGKGVLGKSLTQNLIQAAKQKNKKILIDPKGKDYTKYKGATLLTPNRKEASEATNMALTTKTALRQATATLKEKIDLQYGLITLSEDGLIIYDGKDYTNVPTKAKEVFDVTGAGDTVLASLGFALACGEDIYTASKFSMHAASVVVGKIGSATATLKEIKQSMKKTKTASLEDKIITAEEFLALTKDQSKKIVFTNGCFDILHAGHVSYLHQAKNHGDVLVLGLNSDASVQRLKGKSRPINTCKDRALVLSALASVDYIIEFDEDTPYSLIKSITPDVLIKGADYEGKEVVGSDIAKTTVLIDFVDQKSTTNTINKIKQHSTCKEKNNIITTCSAKHRLRR